MPLAYAFWVSTNEPHELYRCSTQPRLETNLGIFSSRLRVKPYGGEPPLGLTGTGLVLRHRGRRREPTSRLYGGSRNHHTSLSSVELSRYDYRKEHLAAFQTIFAKNPKLSTTLSIQGDTPSV